MSRKNYYFMLVLNFLVNMIIYFPSTMFKDLSKGLVWSFIIGLLIASFNTLLYIKTFNKFNDMSITDISKAIFKRSKVLRNIINISFILINVINGFFIFGAITLIAQKYIMPTTSTYILGTILLMVTFTAINNDETSMLNATAFITLICLFSYFLYGITAFKKVDLRFIKGVIYHSANNYPSFDKVVYATFFFNGVEALAVFNPALPKVSIKKTYLTYLFIGVPIAILILFIPIGIWGPAAVEKLKLPTMSSADSIGIDLFVIERALFILFPTLFIIGVSAFCSYIFVGLTIVKRMINKKAILYLFYITGSIIFLYTINKVYDVETISNLCLMYRRVWIFLQCSLALILFAFSRGVKE